MRSSCRVVSTENRVAAQNPDMDRQNKVLEEGRGKNIGQKVDKGGPGVTAWSSKAVL